MEKIKVMIVDDVEAIRDYFSSIISHEPDMEVVATAGSGIEAVSVFNKQKCDVILMDMEMESRTAGIEAIEAIKNIDESIKIIVITIHEDDELIFKAYTVGAKDYIIKTSSVANVLKSIRNTMHDEFEMRSEIAEKIISEFRRMRNTEESLLYTVNILTKLSNSEFEVLKSVYFGMSYTQIAHERYVEVATIKKQVSNILKKFDQNSMKAVVKILKQLEFFDRYVK